MKKARPFPLRRVFLIPALLFAISLGGLIWALLVEGAQDIFAGLATGICLAVPAGFVLFRRR